jgi:galactokinase
MESSIIPHIRRAFEKNFPGRKELFLASAPGRVNLIGEHTDYNDGFVMPFAIDRRLYILYSPNGRRVVNLYSMNYGERDTFPLPVDGKSEHPWADYVRGIFHVLCGRGHRLVGMDAVIYGDVPMGAGLSSSAALETASVLAADTCNSLGIPAMEHINIARECENRFVGVGCGIMDPFVSRLGKEGHALVIDCRDLSFEYIPMGSAASVVVADTMVAHELTDGKYNERRRECETACKMLNISSLRDMTGEAFKEKKHLLTESIRRRAAHVIFENERVSLAAEALSRGDVASTGQLMFLSHASLRDDYAVSCHELDIMVSIAKGLAGVYGSRLTGAGFGGSTVNLVHPERVDGFKETLTRLYEKETGITPRIRRVAPAGGAEVTRL